ncbi:hypothetical protein AB685_24720 [Bacillus sp. LL01]|uniref:FUSC family protein n=1 Tax=Bacillus sp. LL01 TaxID=1665556 RepID=UPI00064D3592|nr:aromatic acid exporter family protein [Bacillus sp. LL01]KMJ55917.1 hypothetical protein AB685_24720 [Bacillus sp. LL01]
MKKLKFPKNLIGGRVIKTGVAVFITALVCQLLNLPVAFAIVTAIVTIEPTAADSIRKGMQRFPASLIGTAISLTVIYIFGQSPLAYTLAAVLTIVACTKLKLEAGTLVATLAAVAIVPTVEANYMIAFFERAGTTTIALVISTVVNVSILPPKFSKIIAERNLMLFGKVATLISQIGVQLPSEQVYIKKAKKEYDQLTKEIEKSLQLCQFQLEEWKFHKHSIQDMRRFHFEQKKLQLLQQILYHLNSVFVTKINKYEMDGDKRLLLSQTLHVLSLGLNDSTYQINAEHVQIIKKLDTKFWHIRSEVAEQGEDKRKYHHHFSTEAVLYFALLSIHDILEELEHLRHHYQKFKPTHLEKETST